jgi:hypothetical protein
MNTCSISLNMNEYGGLDLELHRKMYASMQMRKARKDITCRHFIQEAPTVTNIDKYAKHGMHIINTFTY